MTEERDEKLSAEAFEAFLEGRSRVARGYARLRDVEPPPELDRAVLEAARAAASRPRSRPAFRSRWASRLAVAAVVVLAVAVTLQLQPPSEKLASQPPRVEDRPAAATDATGGAPPAPAATDARVLPERGSRVGRHRVEALEPHVSAELEVPAVSPAPPPVAPVRRRASAPASAEDEGSEAAGAAESEALPGSASAARRSMSEGITYMLGRPLADRLDPRQEELLRVYDEFRDERARDPDAAGPAPAAPPPWHEDPELWLRLIDALLADGDEEAARRELAAFAQAWPEHELHERYGPWLPAADPKPPPP